MSNVVDITARIKANLRRANESAERTEKRVQVAIRGYRRQEMLLEAERRAIKAWREIWGDT